jgi:hypothetical protein
MRRVLLYTIGQGTPLFERYGHTLLCVQDTPDIEESGTCTDFGVSNAKGVVDLAWGTLRGHEMFVATAVPEKIALDTFRGEGRSIDRQVLPLEPTDIDNLAATLQHQVESGWSYAYHPRLSNCASHPRDLIGIASSGTLRLEAEAHPLEANPDLARYRDQFEAGLSGHLGELMIAEVVAGTPAEPRPTAWETMYQPDRLRDGVAKYLGAPVESIAVRVDHPLPTSPSIGRGAFLALAVVLYALAVRMHRLQFARFVIGLVLGVPALALELLAAVSVWPEFSHNWVLALLWPTDLALPWMRTRTLMGYARVRVAVAALVALGELAGVVAQPILPIALLAALPMIGILIAHRKQQAAATPAAALSS